MVVLAAVGLAGCDSEPQETVEPSTWMDVTVFTDPDTGVQYLISDGMKERGITVRLNPDGTPMVVEVDK